MPEVSLRDVEKHLSEKGKRGAMTLKVLGNLNPFIEALSSEIGQLLLQDDIDRHEELLVKMYNENTTPQELAEFRYLKRRLENISSKISKYNEKVREITSGRQKEGN